MWVKRLLLTSESLAFGEQIPVPDYSSVDPTLDLPEQCEDW